MKHKKNISYFKIIAALLFMTVVTAAWSNIKTEKGTQKLMPVFSDVTDENRTYIENVYMNGIMSEISKESFGVAESMTAAEAAYVAVVLHESRNDISGSFKTYSADNAEYINKATEYGIWPQINKQGTESITRAEWAAVFAPFAAELAAAEDFTGFIGMENNAFAQSAIELYNRGISLDKRIGTAYSTDTVLTRGEAAKLITMLTKPELRITEFMPDYAELRTVLENMMSGYQGDWSLYFEDYASGDVISINSHQVYSASLIKLFVTQALYTRMENGTLQSTAEIENMIYRLITISDNDAWRALARILGNGSYMAGMASVTDVAKSAGFNDTGQFMQGGRNNYNFTSVNDCGAYMRKVLNGEIVSPEYSEKILSLLKQQQIKIKIPSGIPEGITVANKTGELEYIQGDAAIVYAPSGTYILAVIGDSLENSGIAQAQIRELSKAIYEYLNN